MGFLTARTPLTLGQIAAAIGGTLFGDSCFVVRSLTNDSRLCVEGSLFVASRGVTHDGHLFVDELLSTGRAIAVIVEDSLLAKRASGVLVENSRGLLPELARLLAGDPSRQLSATAVTGTNGKTTVTYLASALLSACGINCGRIGTIDIAAPGFASIQSSLTTPDVIDLHGYLAQFVATGNKAAVFEASSHAIVQGRTAGIQIRCAIFTNLTRDHLDYHQSMQRYFEAKSALFQQLLDSQAPVKHAIICNDDPYGASLAANLKERARSSDFVILSYGFSQASDVRISDFQQRIGGSSFSLGQAGQRQHVDSPLIGRHNALNVTAALLAVQSQGIDYAQAIEALRGIPQVPGRLEGYSDGEVGVYIDYAHTPDALENALQTLRDLSPRKLYCVFGCGGDRDKGKRPQMGLAAAQIADKIVLTSDNPRTESPQAIIDDILTSGIAPAFVELDRGSAIARTIGLAEPGDVILLAGKGHEQYQVFGQARLAFSEAAHVAEALRLRRAVKGRSH